MAPVLLVAAGVALLASSALLRRPLPRITRVSLTGIFLAIGAVALWVSSASWAVHTEITSADYASASNPWNGKKVYLSSPRHSSSGQRGECGWEENINGRYWNFYAAVVNTGGGGSFHDRTYDVQVSGNARDDLYMQNVQMANSWGADVYIVTHTNAFGSCGNSASYVRVMYRTGVPDSSGLATELMNELDPALPGGQSGTDCDGLDECLYANATHRSYVELFFHTNPSAVSWFQGSGTEGNGGVKESWRYGWAVDLRLGYPR